ncbi:MAG: ATP-dependent protease ATPase subunit HslU [Vulcanimicrobiota bacterium]
MKDLTPRRIVKELDKYIVGQKSAKKKVAIAMRNRYRRSLLPEELKEEVIPKNILMIGPTGVGKTEIARRLSRLANAPFTKVEATKYTEVGYVGRDVESMVRDLMEIGIRMVQNEEVKYVEDKAEQRSIDRILDAMKPMPSSSASANPFQMILGSLTGPMEDEDEFEDEEENEEQQAEQESRKKKLEKERDDLRQKIVDGELDNIYVEIEVEENPNVNTVNIFSQAGMEEMGIDFQSLLGNFMPRKTVKRNLKVKDAKKILQMEEAHKLIDREEVKAKAVKRVEQHGIIFIDEMDKVAGREKGHGPDVSREGVQRDILPIVEGSNVITKYGPVKTDHILFIAAGAFNISKPSDLIPELQGRFPIRVEMESLFKEDFIRILVEPRNALTKQYEALLASDGVEITFDDSGIDEMAGLAQKVNDSTENIGARRLHTILEKLLEDLAFEAPETENRKVVINREYVKDKLKDIVEDQDLTRFIL